MAREASINGDVPHTQSAPPQVPAPKSKSAAAPRALPPLPKRPSQVPKTPNLSNGHAFPPQPNGIVEQRKIVDDAVDDDFVGSDSSTEKGSPCVPHSEAKRAGLDVAELAKFLRVDE